MDGILIDGKGQFTSFFSVSYKSGYLIGITMSLTKKNNDVVSVFLNLTIADIRVELITNENSVMKDGVEILSQTSGF